MSSKFLKLITQILLLCVIAIIPFLKTSSLYFPYISGKVYVFRLLVSLSFFFWVWLILENQKSKIKNQNIFPIFKNVLVVALLLFFLAQVLVSFFGVDPRYSLFSSIERADGVLQYGFWVLYFLMLISVFKKEQDWKKLFSVFIIVAILSSLYSWFNYSSQIRLYAIFGNSSYFAAFLLFAAGFGFIILERKFFKNILLKVSVILAILFFIITLVATQTRGAYVGLAGGIFLFCLLATLFLREEEDKSSSSTLRYARVKENKKVALFCGIALAVGLVATIALFSARETDFVQNRYILKRTTSVANLWEDDVVRERLLVWQIALNAFKERPVFGWGPENFGAAANKYYDYRVGVGEPWFDRAHSQPIDTLATGGIVLFSFYLFWLIAAVFLIFRIAREKKILSFILASIFLAYFLQGLFLFDTLPTFLGLFPFLAFLIFEYNLIYGEKKEENLERKKKNKLGWYILIPVACFSLFLIYATCFIPYKANALALKFHAYTKNGIYKEAKPFLGKSYAIKSPYTFWEVRKRTAWQFVNVLEYDLNETTSPEDIKAMNEIYDFITPELERFGENRPYDPQMYYILGRAYRLGFEKLGKNDLDKAEIVLKKGFNYSDLRIEYYNELLQVLILKEKFEEAENLIKEYIEKISSDEESEERVYNYVALGNLYFVVKKYDLAWERYENARTAGYKFYNEPIDYARYMTAAEEVGKYQKIVDMAENYLEKWGPDADTFFNIAVGYLNLEEKEKAREFFLKAVELDREGYEEYRPFFAP